MIHGVSNFLFNFYQGLVKPLTRSLGFVPHSQACRFTPSCSAYCRQALKTSGPVRGSLICLHRLLKCHPLHPGGYDPLPY